MIKVKVNDTGEAGQLLSVADYEKFVAEEGGTKRRARFLVYVARAKRDKAPDPGPKIIARRLNLYQRVR